MRWRPALSLVLSVSCATTSSPVQRRAESSKAGDSELSAAFEEAAPGTTPVAKPPPPLPDIRAPFRDALAASQRALGAKDLGLAMAEAERARQAAQPLGVVERVEAAEQLFKVAMQGTDAAEAQRRARAWLVTCGGPGVEKCRASALTALSASSRLDPSGAKVVKEEVAALQRADACAKQGERTKRAERCLAEAERLAAASGDEWLQAQVQLVQALAAPAGRQTSLLQAVESRCRAVACVTVRRAALAQLMKKAKSEKKLEEAATYALRDAHAAAEVLPEAERLWGRPPQTDAMCASYDAARGAGACRALEKQLFKRWTFRDFTGDPAQEGLTREQVQAVNEHFAPLLQECLSAQARRLKPPEAVRYEVRWMVFNDGRVGEVHFRQSALERSELGQCLRAQFETWRYPRYEGEWQHVEQSFTVTAVERRT